MNYTTRSSIICESRFTFSKRFCQHRFESGSRKTALRTEQVHNVKSTHLGGYACRWEGGGGGVSSFTSFTQTMSILIVNNYAKVQCLFVSIPLTIIIFIPSQT